ncbi:MAG TPA: phage tail protein [Sphingopyxis sp.]|nr:phage tail protein [Sphingopyxis sp.]
MSKVLKIVSTIAGIATLIPGPHQPFTAAIAAAASVGAQVTAKRPPAQGGINNITVDPNAPSPYIIGRTYYGGVLRHDVGYGGKVGKVQNPYRGMVIDYSVCGPVQGLVSMHADFVTIGFSGAAATGYYSSFMYRDFQLGATPESSALSPQWGGMPGWGASHKLSGKAAILWSLKFNKDGEVYTSGVPQLGAVWDGVKVYNPRLDDTYPGGSGAQRSNDRTTWAFSEWPDDHALTYALGHWYSGKKMFGIGLSIDAIDVEAFVAWGNVCRANGWKVGGVIFEPDDRWANLKRIMAAGSAEPIFSGGVLSVKYDAPRVSLVTITPDDYADGAYRTRGMQTWRERINTIVPKYRSPSHKWEFVEAAEVSDSGYLSEDGEEKADTIQFDLVQDLDQATQLAAYRLVNGREMFPIKRNLKPEFRFYRPGDMVTIDDPEGGLIEQNCVIVRRSIDPQTLAVRWVLMSETSGKHDFALGKTGTAPPTPTLLDPADRDAAANINNEVSGARRLVTQSVVYPITSNDDTITISAFVGVINDGRSISFPADSITGLSNSTQYALLWHIADAEYSVAEYPAADEMEDASFVFLGWVTTSSSGSFPPPETPPGGWGGGGSYPQFPEMIP